MKSEQLQTPDGRYIIVHGRSGVAQYPALSVEDRKGLIHDLMDARRVIARLRRESADVAPARAAVDRAKVALGERGPIWWRDGSPDFTRRLVRNTPYADWYSALGNDAT